MRAADRTGPAPPNRRILPLPFPNQGRSTSLREQNELKNAVGAEQIQKEWSVADLLQMHLGFAPSRILRTALELDVFSEIAAGKKTAAEIARGIRATERGTRMLLDAMVGLRLLDRTAAGYDLTPIATQHLVRESPDFIGDMLQMERLWSSWAGLTETVRTGRPYRPVEQQQEAEKFFPQLVRSLHIMNRQPARRTAELLGAGNSQRGLRVIDVACGSGVWGIAVAEADKDARVTAQDFPALLDITRTYVKNHGVERRYEFLPGDLKQVDFGEDRFDIALLGNIVHSEGERSSRDLFRKMHRALRPGGRIVIIDMIPNDERTGPPFALLFAINMLVNTESGGTYTIEEYTRWLKEAGFARVETIDIEWHSPLVVATK
jgi:ubiquinone/menaquinone biosynthesis C-methylase UbiE